MPLSLDGGWLVHNRHRECLMNSISGFFPQTQPHLDEAIAAFEEEIQQALPSDNLTVTIGAGIQRFHVEGDRQGERNGFYALYDDDPISGVYGTWKEQGPDGKPVKHTWTYGKASSVPAEDIQRKRAEREATLQEQRDETSREAEHRLAGYKPADGKHPYLQRKKVLPHDIYLHGGSLVVPYRDISGRLTTLQYIHPDGNKRFLSGAQHPGGFHLIGDSADLIYLVEGYATGATIFEVTRKQVIVCGGTSGMMDVSRAIRAAYPEAKIMVAGDIGNGEETARKVAKEIKGVVVFPRFKTQGAGTDFNDLFVAEGPAAVQEQLEQKGPTLPTRAEFMGIQFPPRQKLIGPIDRQNTVLVHAQTGVGKTQLGVAIANHLISGTDLFHWEVPEPMGVLYVDGEMAGIDLQERMAMYMHLEEERPLMVMNAINWAATNGFPHPNLADPEWQQRILGWAEESEVIILDNAMSLVNVGVSVNSDEYWRPVNHFNLQARAAGKTVIWVDHSNSNNEVYGTKTKQFHMNLVISLRHPPDRKDEDDHCEFQLTFSKKRNMKGNDGWPFEAKLTEGPQGEAEWVTKYLDEANFMRAVEFLRNGVGHRKIAEELGVGAATISRYREKAHKAGMLPK